MPALQIDPKTGERLQAAPQIDPATGERVAAQAAPPLPPVAGAGPLGVPQPQRPAVDMHAAELPQTGMQRFTGVSPLDTLTSVGSHLKNFVAGPYHAFTDAPRNPEEQAFKGTNDKSGRFANAVGQFGLGVDRMAIEPTVEGARTFNTQRKAGNTSLTAPEYDAQGNYTPTAASGILDAIPFAGPWARGVETEAHQKGVIPALAGLGTDILAPEGAAKLAAPVMRGISKLPDTLIRKPLTRSADVPMAGTTITPRMRDTSAQNLGVNYDIADRTGNPALGLVKKFNRDSLVGSPVYDAAAAENTAAVRGAFNDTLATQSLLETPEELGRFNQNQLKANQAGLKESAASKFNQLDESTAGQPVPGAALVGSDAQTILQNEKPFYNKYPSMTPSTAMRTLEDLGKVGDTASYSELQRLRSATHEITSANNDIVKEPGTAMLQQMTGSLDNAITSKGLSPEQASMFRDANGDWADMKSNYDNPSNPLYHAVRNPNPSQLAARIGPQTVENLDNLRPRLGEAGIGALQRGTTQDLMGNTRLNDPNFSRFGSNLYKMPDAYRQSLYGPEMSARLDDIARTTQGMGQDFNPSGSFKQFQKYAEAADLLSTFKGNPLGPVPLLQYPLAKVMNSQRVGDWLMRQPGETAAGAGPAGIPLPPGKSEDAWDSVFPPGFKSALPYSVDKYGYKLPAEPGPTDSMGKPMIRPERPQPTGPQRPYQPQVPRESNIRDIPPPPSARRPQAPPEPPPPLFQQAPQYSGPIDAKMQEAAPLLPQGPDLSHLNQQGTGLDGTPTQIHTAGGGKLPAQYRVIEADSITPSHNAFDFTPNPKYPEGVQERDYFGSRENQLRVIQHAQQYEPDITISDTPTSTDGPPIVTPNGVALGGNSRVMSTQRLYGMEGKGANYKNYLLKKADQYGIDPDAIRSMQKPMLVREVQSDGSTESLHKIGSLLNVPLTGALSSAERAVSMGKGLSADTIKTVRSMLDEGQGGTTLREAMGNQTKATALLMRMQEDGVISSEERPQYVDSASGGMNEEGKRVFEKALMGSIMGDANLMEQAPKNVTAKLNSSIGPLAELASRKDAWNVIPQLRTAIGEHTKMAAANMGVEDYLKQGSMFGKPLDPVAEHLTRVLAQNQNVVRDSFNSYGKDARYSLPGQATFLGPTQHGAFNHAFKSNLSPEQFSNVKPLDKK